MIEVAGHARARCVVLGERDAPSGSAVRGAITAAGYEVSATVGRWPEVLAAVVDVDAQAAVIDLAMAGRAGVRLVTALRALAPRCHVVVLSELRAIDLPALEAGATLVVDPADLRPLTAALRARSGEPVEP